MTKSSELAAVVSSKGQVVIPADVRRRLGLTQGSVLRFVLDDEGVRLLPAAGDVRRLKGRLPKPARAIGLEEMSEAIVQRRARVGAG